MKKEYRFPLLVAITGGIGSGQTTVANFFKKWGAWVINADEKAKEIIQKDRSVKRILAQTFGKEIFNRQGKLNTQKLAALAFKDEISTQKLNQIVHPRMVAYLIEELERARFSRKYPIVAIDAALIYEISIEQMFDAVVTVYAPIELRYKRVKQRDGMTRSDFFARVNKQIPLEEKRQWADFVIDNSGSLDELEKQSWAVYEKLLNMQEKKERQLKHIS
ncbi:dephospho-CoA kinase [Caldithrix abyssi]|uniref:Dephospho-CoA kinase n=1 Tax=Caldithrix abyssi DSM 13497 TaxID=880073 RepID=H1XW79_CALAY|nr:dephospho-CoA kinase [Caldithrix abyssi]APF19039.1 coaE dephospho-CoA kinase [Caldithrix abyssi DSM 13497]EHO42984.1 Dephospho-CoA kinase [Caldithrix abyssi DSM 13497]